jgi:iron complex outermembrane recepter protein
MRTLLIALFPAIAAAQEDAVVVTATRAPQPSLEIPASVDRLYGEEIREGRPAVNLSESLGRVPGIVVQNRQNYAQDLQVSSRGFGARATFGVRGIRLIADGVPATMPDGQGQASTFALGSAESIEVLRGPFSALYGNAAGGVISVETADGPATPTAEAGLLAGSYGTWRAALKYGGQWGALNGSGEISRFETNGYRDHSAAVRDHVNAKVKYGLSDAATLTLVANSLRQPDTQDPLGLTRTQMEENPRQAIANASIFNTRKTVEQDQAGVTLNQKFSGFRMEAMAYGGSRWVEQFLAIPLAVQAGALHSGGVVQLDRGYAGGALRFFTGETLRLSGGIEYERMGEHRRGYVNDNGTATTLKRREYDTVSSSDLFVQAEWRFAERWSAHGGLRHSRVGFESKDYFIGGGNPDDSGTRDYSATTPVAGILHRFTRHISFYGNVGRGFETPTFAELAHQNAGSGLNFALQPARSRHAELGVKAVYPRHGRLNAAVFDIQTRDEIVVDTAAGGRTTFMNAGRTERRGVEVAAETLLPGPWQANLGYTRLDAVFRDPFISNGVPVPSGNRIPGVPGSQLGAQLKYRQPGWYGYLEALYRSRVPVNDVNSEFANAYTVYNAVVGLQQQGGRWRFSEFMRIDNLGDKNYVGSVIVNDANQRFYEPSPRRNMSVGIQASLQF